MKLLFSIAAALALLLSVACASDSGPVEPASTPDLQATVQAAVSAALPTDTPTPPPDIEATVAAGIAATRAAEPTSTPTPEPTPDVDSTVVARMAATIAAMPTPTTPPTPTATPVPTPTPIPTATPEPTATPTPVPTATRVPTPTRTPIPTKSSAAVLSEMVKRVQTCGCENKQPAVQQRYGSNLRDAGTHCLRSSPTTMLSRVRSKLPLLSMTRRSIAGRYWVSILCVIWRW